MRILFHGLLLTLFCLSVAPIWATTNLPQFSCDTLIKDLEKTLTNSLQNYAESIKHNLALHFSTPPTPAQTNCLKNYKSTDFNYYLWTGSVLGLQFQVFDQAYFLLKKGETLARKEKATNPSPAAFLYQLGLVFYFADDKEKSTAYFKEASKLVQKSPAALPGWIYNKTYTPFKDAARQKLSSIKKRFESEFGAYRASFVRGHKHSGLDLRGKLNELVYPIGNGLVFDIHLGFPHLTLVLLHLTPNGKIFFSSYKHIENIKVKPGDWVTENTPLARLFNAVELKKSGFGVNHIHFEIRKNFDDQGKASWTSMTLQTLLKYFENPYLFFKHRLRTK